MTNNQQCEQKNANGHSPYMCMYATAAIYTSDGLLTHAQVSLFLKQVQLITGFQQALNQQLNTCANDDVAINFTQIKFYILVVSGCMQLRLSVTFVNAPSEVCN